ncbi:hypothetical protein U1Q18_046412, partial [Sarracenia purpurea var. burkii]
ARAWSPVRLKQRVLRDRGGATQGREEEEEEREEEGDQPPAHHLWRGSAPSVTQEGGGKSGGVLG